MKLRKREAAGQLWPLCQAVLAAAMLQVPQPSIYLQQLRGTFAACHVTDPRFADSEGESVETSTPITCLSKPSMRREMRRVLNWMAPGTELQFSLMPKHLFSSISEITVMNSYVHITNHTLITTAIPHLELRPAATEDGHMSGSFRGVRHRVLCKTPAQSPSFTACV